MHEKQPTPMAVLMFTKRITQQDVAKALSVSRITVHRWMTGKTPFRLTLPEWGKLAALYGVSLDELLSLLEEYEARPDESHEQP